MARSREPERRRSLVGRAVGLLFRVVRGLLLLALVAAVWSAGFIGVRCYSRDTKANAPEAPVERDAGIPAGYAREEASTFLTLPEWYIVYNTDEYARALTVRPPSGSPYLGSIRQYWRYYGAACDATKGVYPFSAGNHVMLAVIGSSFSIENAIKGIYENTVGRLTEWIAGYDTPEDRFAQQTAAEYGAFMHTVPWYEFPFGQKIGALWKTIPVRGPHMVRKLERRMALTAEYGVKAGYGWLIGLASRSAYGAQDLKIHARLDHAPARVFDGGAVVKVRDLPAGGAVVAIPRYEAFTGHVLQMLQAGARFRDIAGNDQILVTLLAPAGWMPGGPGEGAILDERLLTDVTARRIALAVPVPALHTVVPRLQASGVRVEHLYDY